MGSQLSSFHSGCNLLVLLQVMHATDCWSWPSDSSICIFYMFKITWLGKTKHPRWVIIQQVTCSLHSRWSVLNGCKQACTCTCSLLCLPIVDLRREGLHTEHMHSLWRPGEVNAVHIQLLWGYYVLMQLGLLAFGRKKMHLLVSPDWRLNIWPVSA